MGGVPTRHFLQVIHRVYAMNHVTMKPEEYTEKQCQHNPHRGPYTRLADRNNVCLTVDGEHIYEKYGYYEYYEASKE